MDFISELIDEVIESVVEEKWLAVVGYEGLYEVSDLGRVKSLARHGTCGGILSPSPDKDSYLKVNLYKNSKKKYILIHRLVLLTFLPLEEKEVDHINQIKTDNRLENLRWASKSENKRNKNKQKGCYSSIYKGVYWAKNKNKWDARCCINYKITFLGLFDDELDAAKAYNAYIIANNLQEFAILNDV
jgi:hypothetical protein